MKKIFAIFLAITLFACNSQPDIKTENKANLNNQTEVPGSDAALKFINDYVELSSKQPGTARSWIEQNQLLTDNFKTAYKKLLDDAEKEDPEYGLGFDPILDAQDSPNGFELANYDVETGFVTVKGKEWADFIVVLKVISEHNKWLIDGSGVINIPEDKRAKR